MQSDDVHLVQDPTSEPATCSSTKSNACKTVKAKQKRGRKSKLERSLEVVVDKFMESQRESECKFLELEEKRMKLEAETEKKRMEMEERRREADRQHELQLWTMMIQMGNNRSGYYGPQPAPFHMPGQHSNYYSHDHEN